MAKLISYFGALAASQNLQAMIDNSQEALNSQSIWRNYLTQDIPQPSLTFEAVVGRHRIDAAASVMATGSKKPIRSRAALDSYTGKIPAIGQKIPMNENEFRAMMMLEVMITNDQARKNELMRLLFDDVQRAATAPDKRIDILLLQALSTLTVDVNITNNPDGVAYGVVDLLADTAKQKQGVPTVWSDVATSDPFTDIENFVSINKRRGRVFSRIIMPFEVWMNVKRNEKVRDMLTTYYSGSTNREVMIDLDRINEYMSKNKLPIIEIMDYTTAIETDGKPVTYRPWDENNVTFLPAGNIGVLKNAIAVEERHRAEHVSYAMYGRTLVSKWQENDPILEWTACELNAFPAVDIDAIYILETDRVQASFV